MIGSGQVLSDSQLLLKFTFEAYQSDYWLLNNDPDGPRDFLVSVKTRNFILTLHNQSSVCCIVIEEIKHETWHIRGERLFEYDLRHTATDEKSELISRWSLDRTLILRLLSSSSTIYRWGIFEWNQLSCMLTHVDIHPVPEDLLNYGSQMTFHNENQATCFNLGPSIISNILGKKQCSIRKPGGRCLVIIKKTFLLTKNIEHVLFDWKAVGVAW